MRKILSILMIFIFSYSVIGFYLSFEIEHNQIHKEVQSRIIKSLPESQLAVIKIPFSDKKKIRWKEYGKEFNYEGNMYDVVRSEIRTDTTYYWCFSDEKETKLLVHFDQLIKDQTDHSRSKQIQKKQEVNYFLKEVSSGSFLTEKPMLFCNFSSFYKSIVIDVLSPPPRQDITI
jgi:hypothetical protein